jgi:uncharacterized membrane protein
MMETQSPEHHLHAALERIQNWEQHHVSRVPKPIVRKTTSTSLERRGADWITAFAGSMRFVYIHTIWFGMWILINVGLLVLVGLNFLSPFDPFPFGLLTLVVSLEAIFLATFVMISQNRQGEVADARSQADYDVNVRAEKEVAQIMEMLTALLKYHAAAQDPLSGLPTLPVTPPTSHVAARGA